MREASGFDMLNEKLRGLLNREQETLSKEEELEERLNKGNLSEEEIVQIYEEIVEQVESEELEFRNILELEEEEFQEAIKASKREVKLRRKKFEVILDFEENINQLKVTAENLTENFSQEVFEEFLYHHN